LVLANRDSNADNKIVDRAILLKWIRKAKKGDIGAYQNIYEAYARKILNFVYRMVNSLEEAEDLTQDTFVAVYQKLGTLKDNRKFEPWLFRIARNYVYQRYRTRTPSTVSIDSFDENSQQVIQLEDTGRNPDEVFQSQELESVVADTISRLPEKYREVFVLSALQHFSYQQIADIVGRSLPSVKTDIHRARLEVRKRVRDYLGV
jgi:RNA polymerase sigma-70 factor (ECF subfamily)